MHVAGSKGKGSTALLTEALLRELGERVGTFTSPHLTRWTERFRLDGRPVSDAALAAAVGRVRPHVEALLAGPPALRPTFFDATTATALELFREAGVERAILEVGLGGRLDSTNAIEPAVTCVTQIELEHTQQLGDSLAAIAGEKAGILKPGRPAVVGRLVPEALEVVRARARELAAPLALLGRDFDANVLATDADGQDLELRDGPLEVRARLAALGAHQADNAALALACTRRLASHADAAIAAAAQRALPEVVLPGRIEVLGRAPLLVVDAAHTRASARALATVLADFPRERCHLVLSISAGKDQAGLLELLVPLADTLTLTRAEPQRSLDPGDVARTVRALDPNLPLHVVPNPFMAVRAAREAAGPRDLLCATGSVYLAGIARSVLLPPPPGSPE